MIEDLDTTLRRWRHDLHQRPETGFAEHATAAYVADVLRALGLRVEIGVGGTGVVGSLRGGGSDRAIGFRADMDGLPLQERGGHAHISRNEGVMHACGHDGHMAMLLGAAAELAAHGDVDGAVYFFFQPAEEHGRGAQAMIDDKLFDRFPVEAVYGLHNMPGLPAGELHTRDGGIMASEDNFEIRITGRGGHAARPHMVIDPLVVSAEIVLALQTIVGRNVDPYSSAVVSCTEVTTDGARNAIPDEVVLRGDTRVFDPDVQTLLEHRMRELCEHIAVAHGASCIVTYTHEFAPTTNDAAATAVAVDAAVGAVGAERVNARCAPSMASEDFGVLASTVPGCFAFLGNGTDPARGGMPLHSREYDFNDDVLRTGVDYYVALSNAALSQRKS
ncbi:amidohydrolase [Allosaccharopolyspora coralli]|uniref:Amidohydrolase n=1 Tax=Allosaccharopolyspora coralli TaxID=2665642 RepID=A0A5Q3Q999_9PSEU|nr:amidohydrolase [Allosaccharopolyspora coralli]QGK70420.1 amidohydrolase [Allosaccharopolyspora coralli]